ncbi:MAG: chromate transporter, partial [Nitrospirota bacterium]
MNKPEAPSLAGPASPPLPVTFWQAFVFWLKLGFISFGGPAGQIAIMHQEL